MNLQTHNVNTQWHKRDSVIIADELDMSWETSGAIMVSFDHSSKDSKFS